MIKNNLLLYIPKIIFSCCIYVAIWALDLP